MPKKIKTCAIIQVRMGSKRLKGKMLLPLRGSTVLGFVVKRVQAVNVLEKNLINEIIVATTQREEDNAIADWCAKNKVKCFRGSSEDVLDRYYRCANRFSADWILRITGDCPLIEPMMIYGLLKNRKRSYQALAFNKKRIPAGWDCELFSFEKLKWAHENSKEREHVSKDMRFDNEDDLDYGTEFVFPASVGLELNTKADYERICKYVKCLYGGGGKNE